jgi:hypothetical protein
LGVSLTELNQIIKGSILEIPNMPPTRTEPVASPLELIVVDISYFHAANIGTADPIDKIYVIPPSPTSKISAFRIRGRCLEPDIHDGDYIVVDENFPIVLGDIIVCSTDGEYRIGYLKKIEQDYYIQNGDGYHKLNDCKAHAKVIQITKKR